MPAQPKKTKQPRTKLEPAIPLIERILEARSLGLAVGGVVRFVSRPANAITA